MTARIMLDLETLGQRPGAVIVAIGACFFGDGKIGERFYQRVDVESCEHWGLRMDASTVLWWLRQADEARLEMTRAGISLPEALEGFTKFVGDCDPEMWGNGVAFDNVLLGAAYQAVHRRRPWHFSKDRCYRTMKALGALWCPQVKPAYTGTLHNAADDAEAQARHLMEIEGEISGTEKLCNVAAKPKETL